MNWHGKVRTMCGFSQGNVYHTPTLKATGFPPFMPSCSLLKASTLCSSTWASSFFLGCWVSTSVMDSAREALCPEMSPSYSLSNSLCSGPLRSWMCWLTAVLLTPLWRRQLEAEIVPRWPGRERLAEPNWWRRHVEENLRPVNEGREKWRKRRTPKRLIVWGIWVV